MTINDLKAAAGGTANDLLREAADRVRVRPDLMCWCSLPARGGPDHCHAVVLLEMANRAASPAEEMRAAARGLRDSGQLPAGTAVALAVADWLDQAARDAEEIGASPWVLAVARALAAEAFSALGSDGGGAA